MKRFLTFIFCLLMVYGSYAQMVMRGLVRARSDSSLLNNVSVENLATGHVRLTDSKGGFSIRASLFDTLVLTHLGFGKDTVVTDASFFADTIVFYISQEYALLKEVTVYGKKYHADSLAERKIYDSIAAGKRGIAAKETDAQFGVTLNPITYLSRKEKDRRRYMKDFLKQEKEKYIDYRFSQEKVSGMTGLKGDSLRVFMAKYRPDYEFCKKSADIDIVIYINDSLKEFLNPKQTKSNKRKGY